MMESAKEFTEEATQVLESYVSSVSKALEETELTPKEIAESIAELRYHIVSQCEIRSKSNVISTDLVKLSIKKLGDPKTIAESLQTELNFAQEVKEQETIGSSSIKTDFHYPPQSSGYRVKASHISAIYNTFCWLMTSTVIFVLFDTQFNDVAYLFAVFYAMAIVILILSRNLEAYMYNRHLQKYVKPNFHTSFVPIIYGFIVLVDIGWFVDEGALWTVPASLVIWLILSTTEYGRKYYLEILQAIFEMVVDGIRYMADAFKNRQ